MGEYASRSGSYAGPTTSTSYTTTHRAEPTPAERARDAASSVSHHAKLVETAVAKLEAARTANDLPRWQHERAELERTIAHAERANERAQELAKDAPAEASAKIEESARSIEESELRVRAAEPPKGYATIAQEEDLIGALQIAVSDPSEAAYAQKEARLRELVEELPPTDIKILQARISHRQPQDVLMTALWQLGPDRRHRLGDFAHRTERRKARELAAARRAPAAVVAVQEPETSETRITRTFERIAVDQERDVDAKETDLESSLSALDGTERRTLARRLESYRPGMGDLVGAHFVRFDQALRVRAIAFLRSATVVVPTAENEDRRAKTTDARSWMDLHNDAPHYLDLHRPALLATLRSQLAASQLSTGSSRLQWNDVVSFIESISIQLAVLDAAGWSALLHPFDPWAVIDGHRAMDSTTSGAMGWIPSVGIELAADTTLVIQQSLARMSARYVTEAGTGDRVTSQALVPSHPMDRVVGAALCSRDAVTVDHSHRSVKTTAHDVQRDGVRLVSKIEWLGASDPSLWNWLKVDEPADATLEELATTLWGKPDYAYGLVVAWPCISIPVRWARALPATRALEPTMPTEGPESQLERIAGSTHVDDVALAQALSTPKPPMIEDRAGLIDTLDSSSAILAEVVNRLDPVALTSQLDLVGKFIRTKRSWISAASREDTRRWAPVFIAQHGVVSDALDEINLVLALAEAAGAKDAVLRDDRSHPAMQLLDQLREVVATSMFGHSARTSLERCRAARPLLAVRQLERSATRIAVSVGGVRQAETVDPWTARGRSDELEAEQARLTAMTGELRSRSVSGKAPDADAIEMTSVAAEWLEMRTSIANLQHAVGGLRAAIEAADRGFVAGVANLFSTDMKTVPVSLDHFIYELQKVDDLLASSSSAAIERRFEGMPRSDGLEFARTFAFKDTRAAKTEQAREQLKKVANPVHVKQWIFDAAEDTLHDANVRAVLVHVGVMVALAAASAGIASIAGEFATGIVGARGATTIVDVATVGRAARIAGGVTNFVVDATVNAAGQTVMDGNSFGASFAENLITNAAVLAALKPLHTIARSWGVLDEQAFAMWQHEGRAWKVAIAKGTVVTAEMVTSAAVGYASHRALAAAKGEIVDEKTVSGWAVDGAALVLGHYVHGRLGEGLERLRIAGRTAGDLVGRFHQQLSLAGKLEHAGTVDAKLDLLVSSNQLLEQELAFWRSLLADPKALQDQHLSTDQIEVRIRGAEAQVASVRSWGFAEVQFRLAGLEQEVPGGRLWAGDTEDIATALAHAERIGLLVTIEHHDLAARQWRIKVADKELVIRERARAGRVRDAVPGDEVSRDTVSHAKRYAEAARLLRPKLDAYVKGIVEAKADFATEVLHLGEGFGGVMHRHTRFEEGLSGDPHSELVLFVHHGPMTNRGALRSGQKPDDQTMPGVRTREHSIDQNSYAMSQDLGDATLVGGLETQTPAYRAEATALERLTDSAKDTWAHPSMKLRVRVKAASGERWIYCNHFENAGGMGPTNFAPAKTIAGDATFAELRARGRLLAGDDPDLSTKFRSGERVLIWGGSPTGAWAGEDAALHGSHADVVGEGQTVRRNERTPVNEVTAEDFEQQLKVATAEGDSARVSNLIRDRLAKTHIGSRVPRNQQPGASYGPHADELGIKVELGVPTAIRLLEDGKVEVTIGVGEHPGRRVYDRVVMALGQDPGTVGGPAGLLGRGVTKLDATGRLDMSAPVPEGTIALHMVLDRSDRLVGLESEDGSVKLVGAAYAHPRLAAWVIPSERATFIQKMNTMSTAGERTHTGATISIDSDKVTTGIEAQRDRIPVANEVTASREYKLPHSLSADRLALPLDHVDGWAPKLEDFFTRSLRARPGRVEVIPQSSGRDGVHLFRVVNGGEDLGLVRIYDHADLAANEAQVAARVHAAVPSLEAGVDRGAAALEHGGAAQLTSHPRGSHGERAETYEDLVDAWTHSTGPAKAQAFERLAASVTSTTRTLAQVHERLGSGALMTAAAKQRSIDASFASIGSKKALDTFGPEEVARLRTKLEGAAADFQAAKLPSSALLGRADADAFAYRDFTAARVPGLGGGAREAQFAALSVEDLGAAGSSIQTGAADLAQYLESLRRDPRLSAVLSELEDAGLESYRQISRSASKEDLSAATRWYSLSVEIIRLDNSEPSAAARIRTLLGGN